MKFLMSNIFKRLRKGFLAKSLYTLVSISPVFNVSCGNSIPRFAPYQTQTLSQISFDLDLTFHQATSSISLKATRTTPVNKDESNGTLEWSLNTPSRRIGRIRGKMSNEMHLLIQNDIPFIDRIGTWDLTLNDKEIESDIVFPGTVGLTLDDQTLDLDTGWNFAWSIQKMPLDQRFSPKLISFRFTHFTDKANEEIFSLPISASITSGTYKVEKSTLLKWDLERTVIAQVCAESQEITPHSNNESLPEFKIKVATCSHLLRLNSPKGSKK